MEIEFLDDSGIYCITNIINDKHYIGSAINFRLRRRLHFNELNRNAHGNLRLQRSWNKHGSENFIFVILEHCEKYKLLELEQYYIDTLKPEYNILKIAGSRLGFKHDDKAKEKMSLNHNRSEQATINKSISHIGQIRTKEAIKKFKNTMCNDKWPHDKGNKCKCEECKNKMREYKRLWARNYKLKQNVYRN